MRTLLHPSSRSASWDLPILIVSTTVWEIESNSVGNGSGRTQSDQVNRVMSAAHRGGPTELGLVYRAPQSCLSRHSGSAVQPCCQIRFWKLRTPPKDTWSSETMSSPSILQWSAPAFSSAWCLSLAPGIGTTPLAITQFRATWLRVFPPCFSPTRRSSPTTPSTTPIGWFEKFRLPCGGRATEYLPVSRPWPIGE